MINKIVFVDNNINYLNKSALRCPTLTDTDSSTQAGPKYRDSDSDFDTGIDSSIDSDSDSNTNSINTAIDIDLWYRGPVWKNKNIRQVLQLENTHSFSTQI